ncbi:MAG: transposase, IS204/IS1001/IS1096/IS1165 [uncultured bacterium]|nr:MAG: transposase, IS204/IS1001/IS1096/IS1165 [uncultured bacterium]
MQVQLMIGVVYARYSSFYPASCASILYDLDESRILDVVRDRTEDSAKNLLQTLPENKRTEIAAVAVDMWPAFISAIQSVLPNAAIVHDKRNFNNYRTSILFYCGRLAMYP